MVGVCYGCRKFRHLGSGIGYTVRLTVVRVWYWLHRPFDGGWVRYWLHRPFDGGLGSIGYTVRLTVVWVYWLHRPFDGGWDLLVTPSV